ncbi:MAG: thioredoxin fold domain-containing protein [Acetobacteraceae bacterium]|nr:thioredoxin fold domain-containing protein [Acetobacteraceae bacterium]
MTEAAQIVCPHCDTANRVPLARLADRPLCGACRKPLFEGSPVALSDERFRRHLRLSGIPLLVDFWASWCGPCRLMGPALEEAAAQLQPRIRAVKVSTEEAPQLAQELGIRSIPTLVLFAGGRELARRVGVASAGQIVGWASEAGNRAG